MRRRDMLLLILAWGIFCALFAVNAVKTVVVAQAEPAQQTLPTERQETEPVSTLCQLRSEEEEKQPFHILLIGQDSSEEQVSTRSDTIILCSFQPNTGQLILTSFLRDLYVPIPGHGSDRINASYAFGGTQLLKETLETNFDLKIDGCIQVDFAQFAQIIDCLGGVELEIRPDEIQVINRETGSSLAAGLCRLNGEQALAYSRIRKLDTDGDFSRTERQRKVLQAIWRQYRNSSLTTLVKTMGTLLPMIQTDLGSGKLLSFGVTIFPYLQDLDVVSQRIPADGQYEDRLIRGMYVLVADMEAAKQTLHRKLYAP